MARTNEFLFGDQGYTEHDLEVIIENGLGAAEWERLRNIENRFASQSRWKSWLLKKLTSQGIPVAAATAIYKAYFSPLRQRDPVSLGKRLRSKQAESGGKMPKKEYYPDVNGDTDDEMGEYDDNHRRPTPVPGGDEVKGAPGGPAGASKETPITVARPIYQVPRTQTVVVPMTYYFSVVVNTQLISTDLRIVMNANRGHIISTIPALPTATPAGGSGVTQFPQHVKASNNLGLNKQRIPTTRFFRNQAFFGTSANTEYNDALWVGDQSSGDAFPVFYDHAKPANRDMWEKLYNFYTVLGNEWELTIQNASNPYEIGSNQPGVHHDAVALHDYETASVNDINDIIPTGVRLYDCMFWPDSNFTHIPHHDNGRPLITSIKGRYKGFGDNSVLNAMDDKRWNKVAELPTKQDILHVKFWPDAMGMNNHPGRVRLNVCLTMKQIIQYKGLRQNIKWPSSLSGPFTTSVVYPTDIFPRAS